MKSGRLVSIQLLRAVAACAVVFTHDANITLDLRPGWTFLSHHVFGAAGVDIFFVISGFIITSVAANGTGLSASLAFLRRRYLRVAPIFYVACVPFVVGTLWLGHLDTARLIATLAFWPVATDRIVQPYLAVGWTLCFEMLFYTCMAVSMLGNRVVVSSVLLIAYAAAVATRGHGLELVEFIGNPIILEFLFGCFIALAWQRWKRPGAITAASLVLIAFLFSLPSWTPDFTEQVTDANLVVDGSSSWARVGAFGIAALAFVVLALCFEGTLSRSNTLGKVSILGDASYSLYLFHPLVFVALHRAWVYLPAAPAWLIFLVSYAAAICFGLIMYAIVERPLQRGFARLNARANKASAPPRIHVGAKAPLPDHLENIRSGSS